MTNRLFSAYTLPNGGIIPNCIAKAAMEENLANAKQQPDSALFALYDAWAKGGVGLIITGNVMVDRYAMTGPGGVALEADSDLAPFTQWASIAKQNNARVWMQLNHPGRQVFKAMGGKNLAPSAIALDLGKHSSMFTQPKAMNHDDITDVIERFATTASMAQQAGFDGVQVHAAHGYLLAQFLSPLTNKRTDEWGGTLENRAKLLLDVVKQIRQRCGDTFDIAVKLNSADFQRGGFDVEDAEQVINLLAQYHVDVVELSGGSYEAPAMQGRSADERTLAREAYFLSLTSQLVAKSPIPLMLTGGIRRKEIAEQVLDAGFVMCGIASALAFYPNLANLWQTQPDFSPTLPRVDWQNKTLAGLATMAIIKRQLRRMSQGATPQTNDSALWSLVVDQFKTKQRTKRYRHQLGITND
ncbi:NADH:flavin oxidoreductase/NADH oxidase family protein [Shewanella inventionis]|uniref:2,4-dienoyl-CoA reductase n=1 Tax=Shewanella inventionis TaxID=1738770 RepID=A0ABQ1IWI2_9GAMM|nr:NADH:flavin oxidoreductase/NADH oxidase family protein [Shewanella inventionis]MCL1156837.1 NADH:flavin oxidoreductase/NADH oxidase family protein [Shewanella inventionis]UAL45229.1 NADH:flavin oxidoreductase/NADH oxidase family protein [Shewanella inventionis]GGB51342.1 2,4-dienoyl-CoA reductase [Shewanella inventionis]